MLCPPSRSLIMKGEQADVCSEFQNTYLKALHLRRMLRHEMSALFRITNPLRPSVPPFEHGVDVLLHPTAIRTAPVLGSTTTKGDNEYLQDLLTVPASLAGLPAMSVSACRGSDGWPVGMSITSQWGMEDILFWVGKGIEAWKA